MPLARIRISSALAKLRIHRVALPTTALKSAGHRWRLLAVGTLDSRDFEFVIVLRSDGSVAAGSFQISFRRLSKFALFGTAKAGEVGVDFAKVGFEI